MPTPSHILIVRQELQSVEAHLARLRDQLLRVEDHRQRLIRQLIDHARHQDAFSAVETPQEPKSVREDCA